MKKMNLWLLASLFIGGMAFTACSSSEETTPGNNEPLIQPGTPVNPANMKMSALSGFVKDTWGDPLSGVTITSGTESVRTDGNGGFVLSKVNTKEGRSVVKFEKDGYVDIVRSAYNENGDVWEVVMVSEWDNNNSTSTFSNSSAMVGLSTQSGMGLTLQGGYKNGTTGAEFSGYVNTKMTYLNPDDENFAEMMPGGDLAAVRTNGSDAQLISYGMTKVDLSNYETGEKLQLADGKPATLTFPVPEKFKDNTPDEIPLWSFNEETGLWEEEGVATYDAGNNVYVGEVTHFSWVNLDYPEVRVRLKIIVKDDKGNLLPGIKVDIDAQKNVTTNGYGEVTTYVPKNTEFYVTVHPADYANYSDVVKETVPAMDKDGSITIVLPTVAHISGKVVNQGEGNNVATVWIDYNGKQTKKLHTDLEGQFYIIAPADYKGAAKLKVRGADGNIKSADIELDGEDHAYTINFSSDVNAGGVGTIIQGKSKITMTIPDITVENGGGVTIVDDYFTVTCGESYDEDNNTRFDFYLQGYKPGQTSYTDFNFSLMKWDGNGEEGGWADQNGKATITPVGSTYHIVASANGHLHGQGDMEQNDMAQFSVDVTVPLYAKGEKKANVTDASSVLPSWAPSIAGETIDYALAVTESPMLGKGGYIIYTNKELGLEQFNALKEEAIKIMGEPISNNLAAQYKNGNCSFQKDDKYLSIRWYGNWEPYTGYDFMTQNFSSWNLTYTNDGIISIVAYDGYKVDKNSGRKAPLK